MALPPTSIDRRHDVNDLVFPEHARDEMQTDGLTDCDVYTVVGDYDEKIERNEGRTEYVRELDDGRYAVVVIEDDGVTVVSAWWHKRRSSRSRRRRR
jgi:hypothetical protein